jgi:hypothetical protein
MKSANVLDPIWESYRIAIDCHKIAYRSIEKDQFHLMNRTRFAGSAVDEAKTMIQNSRETIDDSVIVSLWAIFERKILEYLQLEGRKILGKTPTAFNAEVHQKIENEMEYWKSEEILDLFKPIVDPALIGNAKQIKKYRDWIAHKNPKKGPPSNVPPQTAYRILSKIIAAIEKCPEIGQAASAS